MAPENGLFKAIKELKIEVGCIRELLGLDHVIRHIVATCQDLMCRLRILVTISLLN
jgi:hypothetical protein